MAKSFQGNKYGEAFITRESNKHQHEQTKHVQLAVKECGQNVMSYCWQDAIQSNICIDAVKDQHDITNSDTESICNGIRNVGPQVSATQDDPLSQTKDLPAKYISSPCSEARLLKIKQENHSHSPDHGSGSLAEGDVILCKFLEEDQSNVSIDPMQEQNKLKNLSFKNSTFLLDESSQEQTGSDCEMNAEQVDEKFQFVDFPGITYDESNALENVSHEESPIASLRSHSTRDTVTVLNSTVILQPLFSSAHSSVIESVLHDQMNTQNGGKANLDNEFLYIDFPKITWDKINVWQIVTQNESLITSINKQKSLICSFADTMNSKIDAHHDGSLRQNEEMRYVDFPQITCDETKVCRNVGEKEFLKFSASSQDTSKDGMSTCLIREIKDSFFYNLISNGKAQIKKDSRYVDFLGKASDESEVYKFPWYDGPLVLFADLQTEAKDYAALEKTQRLETSTNINSERTGLSLAECNLSNDFAEHKTDEANTSQQYLFCQHNQRESREDLEMNVTLDDIEKEFDGPIVVYFAESVPSLLSLQQVDDIETTQDFNNILRGYEEHFLQDHTIINNAASSNSSNQTTDLQPVLKSTKRKLRNRVAKLWTRFKKFVASK